MADSDYRSCMEGLFLTFVIVTDTSPLQDGSEWGWLINEKGDQTAFDPTSPGFPWLDEFNGSHKTRALAEDAAVRYIWSKRPDIVNGCKREYNAGKAYRMARSQWTSADLKEAREALGLTQAQMAAAMHMTPPNYNRLERGGDGRSPTQGHYATVRALKFIDVAGLLPSYLELLSCS